MSLVENTTEELSVFTVKPRKITDETSKYKDFVDKEKLKNWLTALLAENEVIMFYIEESDGLEKFVIGTTQNCDVSEFAELPGEVIHVLGEDEHVNWNVPFISMPSKAAQYLHITDITKFIVKKDKIEEISRNTLLF